MAKVRPAQAEVLKHDHKAETERWLMAILHRPMPLRCPGCWKALVQGSHRHGIRPTTLSVQIRRSREEKSNVA